MFRLRLLAVLVALSACAPHSPPPPPFSLDTLPQWWLDAKAKPSMEMSETFSHPRHPPTNSIKQYQQHSLIPIAHNFHITTLTPKSIFNINGQMSSYNEVRDMLKQNQLPSSGTARVEEIINYFDYGYAPPTDGKPFAVYTETVDSPWHTGAKIIKIGIQAQELPPKPSAPANLVFVVNIVPERIEHQQSLSLAQQTLNLLLEKMRPQDKITLIAYNGQNHTLMLAPTPANKKNTIRRAIKQLEANGTNQPESEKQALQTAYREAEKSFTHHGINRVFLIKNQSFDMEESDFDTLKNQIAEKRQNGISLSILGIDTFGLGLGRYQMRSLADAGKGNYNRISNLKEADKVWIRQLSSTLTPVAKDVNVQVSFNPATVQEYRLVGYENHANILKENFTSDINAGHSATALYEIVPVSQNNGTDNTANGEYAQLQLHYRLPSQPQEYIISQTIAAKSKPLVQAGADTRFALAAAAYAQQFHDRKKYNGNMDWQNILDLAKQSAHPDRYGLRQEFLDLIQTAQSLSAKPQQQ
ncbi:vWA domain-containing protein [Conchiformibius steedae]|uniref:DUF3520 domain-containing protein n=1 Tax=Conchiformibius steedae TaxID=153493 RepID=A0A3P2A3E9_9NEIS|nr:von Willebrand factor type A domain-containing protein [Conchiformibius steedae]RRD89458.1 DUF3520 domain-containing protein [Conchiformibius steedae]